MDQLFGYFNTGLDLLLVVIGFSLIIVLHELGHFLAARWAGIRVLAFALGFGPAMVSYRKGLGVRRGSSEAEYLAIRERDPSAAAALSTTEYRWNVLPLGGYVKMLGQDDADPSARSDERDSYNSAPAWKRMIVISAGVIMNLITAAVLFVVVFRVGLATEPAVVGEVMPGSAAEVAVVKSGGPSDERGLKPGDEILTVDGESVRSFNELGVATAMSSPGSTLRLEVKRPGVDGLLQLEVSPRVDSGSKMLALGVGPERSLELVRAKAEDEIERLKNAFASRGLSGFEPGDRVVGVVGQDGELRRKSELDRVFAAGEGKALSVVVERGGEAGKVGTGKRVEVKLDAEPVWQRTLFAPTPTTRTETDHVLGLAPVMVVGGTEERAAKAGLRAGDVFAVLGGLQWPTSAEATLEIRKHAGRTIDVVVWRAKAGESQAAGAASGADGAGLASERELVTLKSVQVSEKGQIGFHFGTSVVPSIVAKWPSAPMVSGADGSAKAVPSGAKLGLPVGAQILSVNGQPVSTLADVWRELRAAALAAPAGKDLVVELVHRRILAGAEQAPEERTAWTIRSGSVGASADATGGAGGEARGELEMLRALKYQSSLPDDVLRLEQTTLHAQSVGEAISMGMRQTRTAMTQTYITFARLFQGSIKVEHLRGPVGIAHVGTLLADKGLIWLMFFMAIISVNLAVVNFLPLPIVDGGHFLFLLYEQFTGRPVSVAFQNATTIAGLLLIASMFVLVTYHDVVRLVWG